MALNQSFAPRVISQTFQNIPDDARRIIHASLKSADDLDGGVVTNPSLASYSSAGMRNGWDGTNGASIKWTLDAGDAAILAKSAHIHLEIDADLLAVAPGANSRIMTFNTGPQKLFVDATGNLVNGLDVTSTIMTLLVSKARPGATLTLDFIFMQGTFYSFVDGFLTHSETVGTTPDFSSITLFASQLGTEVFRGTQAFRNFSVTTGPSLLLSHPHLSNIVIFGDSLSQQGNLRTGLPRSTGVVGEHGFYDIGMTAELIRAIAQRGVDARVTNYAVAGNTLSATQTIVDGLTHLAGCSVVVAVGMNDSKSGSLTAGFEANYQTLVDSITALGADHIWLCNVTSTAEDATVPAPDAVSAPGVDAANAAIAAVAAANANTTLVDLFTLFGGHDPNLDYYKAADLHWSVTGSGAAGRYIGRMLASHYYVI